MKTHAPHTTSSALLPQKGGQPFFQKEGEGAFFSQDQVQLKAGNEHQAASPFFGNRPGSTPFFTPTAIQTKLAVGQPGDQYEQEADAMADQVVQRLAVDRSPLSVVGSGPGVQRECAECAAEDKEQALAPKLQPKAIFESNEEQPLQRKCAACQEQTIHPKRIQMRGGPSAASSGLESQLSATKGGGAPLPKDTRGSMESAFGADFSGVRVHTDSQSMQMNKELGAQAFTHGSDVYFGAGKYSPGTTEGDRLLAHELTHTVQQGGSGIKTQTNAKPAIRQIGMKRIQRHLTGSHQVAHGGFEVDMQTRDGTVNTPPTQSGMDGYIRFIPDTTAPNSNRIVIVQIVKLTDLAGNDVRSATLPAAQAPRGALGQPGLLTQDDAIGGIEGGFFTDVYHTSEHSALSPRYHFQPAAPGTTGTVGQTAQTPQYGGGIGGNIGQTPGFKRSNDPADIRSAASYDFPGTTGTAAANYKFSFETVARGEDTMMTYGVVKWGFDLNAGKVVNERLSVQNAQSATYDEALERHRDFYVHEPVTFYFDYNRHNLKPDEAKKIDTFLDYLRRNPNVQMSLEGFADISGGYSAYNRRLSLKRAKAVKAGLLAKGIDASRISAPTVSTSDVTGSGASTAATTDAGTGDQGGSAALGARQIREANRWANRRVVLTFRYVAPAAPASTSGGTP